MFRAHDTKLDRAIAAAAGDVPRVYTTASIASFVAGETRVNPIDGQTYVRIPPGKFTMGCSRHDSECFDDETMSVKN